MGGSDSAILKYLGNIYLPYNLKRVPEMQQYFQKLRALRVCDINDGRAIGVAINLQREIERNKDSFRGRWKGEHVERCVSIVAKEHKSLSELSKLYPWFISLMEGLLNNNIMLTAPSVNSNMLNLSVIEAYIIGRKLARVLREKATAEMAIDQWMIQHPAMLEMNEKFEFFIPMCIVIGRQKVMDAPWVSGINSIDMCNSRYPRPSINS